ncbi:sugar transferase [Eggerthella guodeyinii]|uniref:Sugar transferase n=1 Tax=Eggerthella guodeyinii TaxID=2690837 RepID=A0A6L7J0N4_9ACTN|nr:sugar transferase [Eggerthella guodeyinii]
MRNEEIERAQSFAAQNLEHANEISLAVRPRQGFYIKYVKRLLDIVLSLFALIITLPVNLVLGIATFFDVGRPLIFKQERTGKDLRTFTILKFRNMTNERDETGELLPPSQRVTKLGKFVRKYSIDELLNFWSILKGDMSIIGPRPMPKEYIDRMTERHKGRYAVRPGLECPLVEEIVSRYPFPEPYSRYQAQFENDLWYVENASFATDVMLVFRLVKMTFDSELRSGSAAAAAPFIGYDERGNAVSEKHWRRMIQQKEES